MHVLGDKPWGTVQASLNTFVLANKHLKWQPCPSKEAPDRQGQVISGKEGALKETEGSDWSRNLPQVKLESKSVAHKVPASRMA